MDRRTFLRTTTSAALVMPLSKMAFVMPRHRQRAFTLALTPGSIGVQLGQAEMLITASTHGFESIEPYASELAEWSDGQLAGFKDQMAAQGIVWAASGLPVDFRRDEARFREGMTALPVFAQALQRAGVTRVGTWLMPNHATRTYRQNFDLHAERLREVATVLGDHGLRFGLEYVGPKTLWSANRYSFVHSMAETKELIVAIDKPNVGFVLDSFHWFTAHETVDDLLTLTNSDIVTCDLNDGRPGRTADEQIDGERMLPTTTGVIDIQSFLDVLVQIGYDGPVRPEPFNQALNAMPNEEALSATAKAMQAAAALVER